MQLAKGSPEGKGKEAPAAEMGADEIDLGLDGLDLGAIKAATESALADSAELARLAGMSEKEVDGMITQMKATEKKIEKALKFREIFRKGTEAFDPYAGLSIKTLDRLLEEGVISKKNVESLQALQKSVSDMLAAKVLTTAAEQLRDANINRINTASDAIDAKVAAMREPINARRAELKTAGEAFYVEWIAELEGLLKSVRENPRVIEKLDRTEKSLRASVEGKRSKELKEAYDGIRRDIQSIAARNDAAFKRLGEIAGDAKVRQTLVDAMKSGDQKAMNDAFVAVKNKMRDAVLHGTGAAALKDPSEVVPWEQKTKIDYANAVDFLKSPFAEEALRRQAEGGDELAKKLIAQRAVVLDEHQALRQLIGSRWSGKGVPGPFWELFKNRDKYLADEASQAAAEAKRTQEARRKDAEFMEKARDIIARGGLVVSPGIYENLRSGGVRRVGTGRGVVRLAEGMNKKSMKVWKVAETHGDVDTAKVGTEYSATLLDAPKWLRDAADGKFEMRGDKYWTRKPEAAVPGKKE